LAVQAVAGEATNDAKATKTRRAGRTLWILIDVSSKRAELFGTPSIPCREDTKHRRQEARVAGLRPSGRDQRSLTGNENG
jgi:hypothetical protein